MTSVAPPAFISTTNPTLHTMHSNQAMPQSKAIDETAPVSELCEHLHSQLLNLADEIKILEERLNPALRVNLQPPHPSVFNNEDMTDAPQLNCAIYDAIKKVRSFNHYIESIRSRVSL